jgi:hypothetical protein
MEGNNKDQGRVTEGSNETKGWLFEKMNKIGQLLAQLTKRKKKIQTSRIRDKKGEIIANTN